VWKSHATPLYGSVTANWRSQVAICGKLSAGPHNQRCLLVEAGGDNTPAEESAVTAVRPQGVGR